MCAVTQIGLGEWGGGGTPLGGGGRRTENRDHIYIYICVYIYIEGERDQREGRKQRLQTVLVRRLRNQGCKMMQEIPVKLGHKDAVSSLECMRKNLVAFLVVAASVYNFTSCSCSQDTAYHHGKGHPRRHTRGNSELALLATLYLLHFPLLLQLLRPVDAGLIGSILRTSLVSWHQGEFETPIQSMQPMDERGLRRSSQHIQSQCRAPLAHLCRHLSGG